MTQEEKLRNRLREYYDTQETPFDENEWERASTYLRIARRKRRNRYVILILVPLASLLTFVLLNLQSSVHEVKPRTVLLHDQRAGSEQNENIASSIPSPQVLSELEKRDSDQTKQDKGSTPAKEIGVSRSEILKSIPEEQPVVRTDKNETDFVAESSLQSFVPAQEGSITKPERRTDHYRDESPMPAENISKSDKEATIMDQLSVLKGNFVETKATNPASTQDLTQGKSVTQVPPIAPKQVEELSAPNTPIENTTKAEQSRQEAPAQTPINTADTFGIAPAGMAAAVENASGDTLSLAHLVHEGLFYEAGAAWLYGWKGPLHRDARGYSPVVGISYMNQLGRHCAFSFGLQYLQVSNLSNSSKTSYVSSYIYGEQSRVTIITPSILYYVLAPFRFQYYADDRNSFGVGINLAYLLNVDAKVTSYDQNPGSTGNYKTIKQSGYTQGFSWFDSQVAFCYRRRLINSLAVQAEVFIGLTDVKQDDFFGFKNKERNSGAKLSLVYYTFRKNNKR